MCVDRRDQLVEEHRVARGALLGELVRQVLGDPDQRHRAVGAFVDPQLGVVVLGSVEPGDGVRRPTADRVDGHVPLPDLLPAGHGHHPELALAASGHRGREGKHLRPREAVEVVPGHVGRARRAGPRGRCCPCDPLSVGATEVDRKLDAGDVPGLVGGEPGNGGGDVLGLAHRVGQGARVQRSESGVTIDQFPQARFESGVDPERVDRVHPDAVLAELVGQGLGQAGDAVLGRHVVGQQRQADQARRPSW